MSSYASYVPKRFMGKTGYQIFVDRFCRVGPLPQAMEGRILKEWKDDIPNWQPDGDGEYRNLYFYGGNLRGIISKLDYLKSIGVDLIYLSPISFTHSSHHYDVEDQTNIDPWIGTWSDFQELCKLAHQSDILVCVDLVFNHMGDQSQFFKEALSNKNSRYHDWFEWDENGNPVFWYGFRNMPQCNKLNLDYQEYAYGVCEFYIKMGVDGIRLDLGENFPREFIQGLRKRVKQLNPEVLIVTEMWEFATHKENPQIYGDQADSIMNYPLSDAICRWIRYGNEKHLEYTLQELSKYPEQVKDELWNFLDSHDVPRAANMLTGKGMNENPFSGRIWDIEAPWRNDNQFDTYAFRKWEAENDHLDRECMQRNLMLASLLQYFAKGVPILYYGTEAGLTGYKDPFCRKPYPWEKPDRKLLQHYTMLGIFRKENTDILARGSFKILHLTREVGIFERKSQSGSLILVINRTEYEQKNPIRTWNTYNWKEVFELRESSKETLKPYGAIVYRISK